MEQVDSQYTAPVERALFYISLTANHAQMAICRQHYQIMPVENQTITVAGIEDVALYAHTTDLRSATIGSNAIDGTQNLSMYFVFAFGKGSTLLRYAAINGGFEDSIPYNGIPDLTSESDNNEDGEPDNFYEATDGAELETSIEAAFSTMLRRASSGTAAS